MMHMSKLAGRELHLLPQHAELRELGRQPPQRVTAWHGIRMARDLNNDYLEPLTAGLPGHRLGPDRRRGQGQLRHLPPGRLQAARGMPLVMIGHAGHEEVVGTTGQVQAPVHLVSQVEDVAHLPLPQGSPLAYVTQTTLSLDDTRSIVDALQQRFEALGPHTDDICYATQNRQTAVRAMASQVDVVLVVGARNSSNSRRLQEVAERAGVTSLLVQDAGDIPDSQRERWRHQGLRIGITAGASTPELLVRQVVQHLQEPDDRPATQLDGVKEDVSFRLPPGLGAAVPRHGR
jgi:4-hydroxy-3-methylbut-2-en-1-yl diphosphate reductase